MSKVYYDRWDKGVKVMSDGMSDMAWDEKMNAKEAKVMAKIKSDGSTASYYALPPDSKELQDLISYKNMNAQIGEIFRECYRYGQASHSDEVRGIKKILFYAQAELKRINGETK